MVQHFQDTTIYRDALIDARSYSTDALLAFADVLTLDAIDPDPDWPGPVGRELASERLRAVRTELERRDRLARIAAEVPTPHDRRYAAWRELAQLVRERVDIVEVFDRCGYHLHDVGSHEAHAACPLCGGVDRLVIRRDPPARVWCRQCAWSGDIITLTMSLVAGREQFRDAVRWLAELAGTESAVTS